jgi:hypothetical protein
MCAAKDEDGEKKKKLQNMKTEDNVQMILKQ